MKTGLNWNILNKIISSFFILLLFSCGSEVVEEITTDIAPEIDSMAFSIVELTDEEYPDNPDIGFRSKNYRWNSFDTGELLNVEKGTGDLCFYGEDGDTITFESLDLLEFIPTIPKSIESDDYLTYISLVNQEWNRNQVNFTASEFYSSNNDVVRVDVARNCLNSYLWEVIAYTQEGEEVLPFSHGWFDFPQGLYADLFEYKNGVSYDKYKDPLEGWIDPENKEVNLSVLRTTLGIISIGSEDFSDDMYPIEGARKKKYKEIITPVSFSTMRDLQTDNTTFATFSVPGFYNREDPRTTELGRIYALESIEVSKLDSDSSLFELLLAFTDSTKERTTNLYLGGIDLMEMPVLDVADANKGWKNSMGIGNHTFYETYEEHENYKTNESPYYALLTNEKNEWLDSHVIGIDGPVIHRDCNNENLYHIWLLSFERHAFVGHYTVEVAF